MFLALRIFTNCCFIHGVIPQKTYIAGNWEICRVGTDNCIYKPIRYTSADFVCELLGMTAAVAVTVSTVGIARKERLALI